VLDDGQTQKMIDHGNGLGERPVKHVQMMFLTMALGRRQSGSPYTLHEKHAEPRSLENLPEIDGHALQEHPVPYKLQFGGL